MSKARRCTKCGGTTWAHEDMPALCGACTIMQTDPNEIDHERLLRCPACGYMEGAKDALHDDEHSDGDQDVSCGKCGHDYTVRVDVSVLYTSPARPETGERPQVSTQEGA